MTLVFLEVPRLRLRGSRSSRRTERARRRVMVSFRRTPIELPPEFAAQSFDAKLDMIRSMGSPSRDVTTIRYVRGTTRTELILALNRAGIKASAA